MQVEAGAAGPADAPADAYAPMTGQTLWDWRRSRSFLALDLDTEHGRHVAQMARGAVGGHDAPHEWDGVVVALLVAKDFTTPDVAAVVAEDRDNMVVVMKVPPGRLPLRSVVADYSREARPYSRTAAACEQRRMWLVVWGHDSVLARDPIRISHAAAERLRQTLLLVARRGGDGITLRTSRRSTADLSAELISPAAFRGAWGCELSRPARILNCMPHLWRMERCATGMTAAPPSWHGADGAQSEAHSALAEAVAAVNGADAMVTDALGLPLSAHRAVLAALGVCGEGQATRWLVDLQRVMLGQLESRVRRARECTALLLRARGVAVQLPLEAVMRSSHRLRHVPGGAEATGCAACGPRATACGPWAAARSAAAAARARPLRCATTVRSWTRPRGGASCLAGRPARRC